MGIDYVTSARATLDENVMGVNVQAAVNSLLAHHEHNDFNQLLPKLGISYKLDKNNSNIYATVAKGYRAGGFNIQMFSDILQTELQNHAQTARGEMNIEHDELAYENMANTIAFKPETSWNYELGTHLNLFNNTLHFDVSAFYMQVHNQQLSVMAGNYGFGRMMVNAGKSCSCGIEASLRGSTFSDRLAWALSYGYTHAVFKEYDESETVSYKDNRVPFVPEHTLAANADYRINFSNKALKMLVVGANVAAQGSIYWDEANTYSQDFYATLGAHVDADFKVVKLSLWGRNLTNASYHTFAVQSAATGERLTFAQKGNPVQLGFDVKLHF